MALVLLLPCYRALFVNAPHGVARLDATRGNPKTHNVKERGKVSINLAP